MKKAEQEYSYEENLVLYVQNYMQDHGLEVFQVSFVANAQWPILPARFALYLRYNEEWTYCTWADPEGWVDLFDSVNRFIAYKTTLAGPGAT